MDTLSVPLFGSARGVLELEPQGFPTNLLLVSIDLGERAGRRPFTVGLAPEHGLELHTGLGAALVELGIDPADSPAARARLANPLRVLGS
jgi:hypothetical protein